MHAFWGVLGVGLGKAGALAFLGVFMGICIGIYLRAKLGNYSWGLEIDYYRYISKPALFLHLSIWRRDLSDTKSIQRG